MISLYIQGIVWLVLDNANYYHFPLYYKSYPWSTLFKKIFDFDVMK